MPTSTAPLGSTARTNQILAATGSSTRFNESSAAPTKSKGDTLPAGVGYQTYNPDGSVRESYSDSQAQTINKGGAGAPMPTDPAQPAPTGAQAGQASYQQAVQNLNTGGLQGDALAGAQNNLAGAYGQPPPSKFQQAHKQLQQGGSPPPDAGKAMSAVSSATPYEPDQSAVDQYISADPNVNTLMQGITQLLQPQEQTTSLMEDYQKLYKESGLDQINHELIDADTVINGTEDDIRNEIQTAGGFGTDSQIQAMALSRNKGLLKRYNQLVQMKTDATNQLNTLSSLNAQDKQMAQTKLNTQIDSMFKLANFRQQAQNNTQEQARWLTQTMGADGLYNAYKNDPKQLSMLEHTLGLAPGGLSTAATQAAKQRTLDTALKNAQIANANRAQTEVVDTGHGKALINSQTGKIIQDYGTSSGTMAPMIDPKTGKPDPIGNLSSAINAAGAKDNANLQNVAAVVAGIQSFADRNSSGQFPGVGILTSPSGLHSSQANVNQGDVAGINLKVQQWASGANLSTQQTEQVMKMVPRQGDTYAQTKDKVNQLTNYMLNQAQGYLASQGIQYKPEAVDFFFSPAQYY